MFSKQEAMLIINCVGPLFNQMDSASRRVALTILEKSQDIIDYKEEKKDEPQQES